MTYKKFAYIYDQLMQDTPYDKWVETVFKQTGKYAVKGANILDVGCGTGELSVLLAESGFRVTGVDLSEDMLAVAYQKANEKGLQIQFFQQNMAEMEPIGTFSVATIFCDSLNYLETEEEVVRTFSHIYEMLEDDGLFLFDVHSLYKVNAIFGNNTFAVNEEKLAYIWQCYEGEYPDSVEHELSFFVFDEATGKYDRFDELHFQRTFSVEQYKKWLAEAGFQVLEVTADFSDDAPQAESERIFFTAKKKGFH